VKTPLLNQTSLIHIAGCTTSWMNYANEPSQAALERSSQDVYGVISLTPNKAAVRTVTLLIELKKIFVYFLTPVAYDSEG